MFYFSVESAISLYFQVDLQSSQKDSVKLSGELRELRAQGKKITELQSEKQLLHSSLLEREQEKTRVRSHSTLEVTSSKKKDWYLSLSSRVACSLQQRSPVQVFWFVHIWTKTQLNSDHTIDPHPTPVMMHSVIAPNLVECKHIPFSENIIISKIYSYIIA